MKTKLILVAALAVITSNVFGAEIPIREANNADFTYILNKNTKACELTNDTFKLTGTVREGKFNTHFSQIWSDGTVKKTNYLTTLAFNNGSGSVLYFTDTKENCEKILPTFLK